MTSAEQKILFMTNAECGQSNVVLAVAQETACQAGYEVHIASFSEMQRRVNEINATNRDISKSLVFHLIPGPSMGELAGRRPGGQGISSNAHAPGFFGALQSYRNLEAAVVGWEPSEYLEAYAVCQQVIQDVKPAALVCEIGLWQAHDAARGLGVDYLTLGPGSAKDFVGGELPGAPILWKWPAQGCGFQFPLSALDTVKTIFLSISFISMLMLGPHFRAIVKARKESGIGHGFPLLEMYKKTGKYLCPFLPELDFTGLNDIPDNVIACGPITLAPIKAQLEGSRDLMHWLGERPTILVNFGSHFSSDAKSAQAIADAFKSVLAERSDIQILWKLKFDWANDSTTKPLLQPLVDEGRLRIVPWLDVDPAALYESNSIICTVHHGGANSFYEACRAGIPQLVLPIWWDTYEYAERVRFLGLGLIGNTGYAPGVNTEQFHSKLLQVLNDPTFRQRAESAAAACERRGIGREIATTEVLQWARSDASKLPS